MQSTLTESATDNESAFGTDELLLAGLLRRDDEAWRQFHREYDRLVYRCITKVTQRFGEVLSSEDVQEVYASFQLQLLSNDMRKLRGFDASRGTKLSTWIGMLAINAAYDHLRTVRREALRGTLHEAEQLVAVGDDPFEALERKQQHEMLDRLMADLSDKDRQFMKLYFGVGLPAQEVAKRMNISLKTVYSKKHKIRARLEQAVQRGRLAA